MSDPLTNPFAPPNPDSGADAARGRQRARWRARADVALRAYAVGQFVVTVVFLGSGLWVTHLRMASHASDAVALDSSVWAGRVRLAAASLGDVVAVSANLLTVVGPRSRTRVPSVAGALVAMLCLVSTIAIAQTKADAVLLPLAMGLTQLSVFLFCLTALSIARDLEEGAEGPALWGVARWQLVALVLFLIAAAVQGTAAASPLGIGIPALAGLAAQGILLFRGAPSLLRLARRAGA
jgi:hypothetical protein